tara:strand:+ start:3833 stop:4093 length:261 start_codon:yes stop_codon:yes gene_type:complete
MNKEKIEEKIKKEVALEMIKFKVDFLVKYHSNRMPEIEKEIKAIQDSDGWSNSINYEAGIYRSVAKGLFKDVKEIQENLKKIFKYE